MKKTFPTLTQSGQIGSLTVKNRLFVSAMGINLAEDDGSCGERIIAFHERHAAGGAGLITLGVAGVAWPHGGNMPRQVAISDDRFIPGLSALASAIHRHDAKLAIQLHHGGIVATEDSRNERPVWVPSYPAAKQGDFIDGFLESEMAIMFHPKSAKPQLHVMTKEDIDTLVSLFSDAALRAKKSGIDAIEIHAGHGYIISEFLSPAMNQRDDEYGGSLENRARLLLEIIAAVRQSVGNDFPLWCKLDTAEFGNDEGITLNDAIATAKMAQAAGVNAITASAYHDGSQGAMHSESNIPHTPERLVENATAIKQSVSIPVITAGRIEPEAADQHIREGHFDFFAMGRKMLADPDLPNKITRGEPEQIRPCVYCYCCASQIYVRSHIKCAVNPETGFERERLLIASDKPFHYAVVGGGPGGMEMARRLALRGFQVTLIERSNRLGGTLQFASIAYQPNENLLSWLKLQVKQSNNITVRLNCNATPALIENLAVDAVIVATGAARNMPDIPGNEGDFVFSGDEMRAMVLAENNPQLQRKISTFTRLMTWLGAKTRITQWPSAVRLASKVWLPLDRQIVIIGAELVGLELAEFLAERGRHVTVIDSAARAGKGLYLVRRLRLLSELRHLNVNLLNSASEIEIGDHNVSYTNYRGQRRQLAADQVIVAKGASGNSELAEELRENGLTVHTIGDCNGVSYIEGAMEQAAELACKLGD